MDGTNSRNITTYDKMEHPRGSGYSNNTNTTERTVVKMVKEWVFRNPKVSVKRSYINQKTKITHTSSIQFMKLIIEQEQLTPLVDDNTFQVEIDRPDFQVSTENYGHAINQYSTMSAYNSWRRIARQNPYREGYRADDPKSKSIMMEHVKNAVTPSKSLATNTEKIISTYHVTDRAVTSEEYDSDDSAVKCAPSVGSEISDEDETDDELVQLIHGQAVRREALEQEPQNEDEDVDVDDEDEDRSLSIAPYLLHGLTVPQNHDYSGLLAEAEKENENITHLNETLVTEGWLQMLTEIRNNTSMCKTFVQNYQGRMDLTIKQVLTWINNNHGKFDRFIDVKGQIEKTKKELQAILMAKHEMSPMTRLCKEQENRNNIKTRTLAYLGPAWNTVLNKKATPSQVRATRKECIQYITTRMDKVRFHDLK